MEDERRREPWPWVVGGLLAGMIAVCIAFAAIAYTHADVELVDRGTPGVEAH